MDPRFAPQNTRTILVCHSNRAIVQVAQVNAEKHGIRVIVARDGKDALIKARGQIRPDIIILSDDLKNPSTDELSKAIKADPQLMFIQVIVLKGLLGNFGDLLKSFKRPPWIFNR